MINYFDVLKTIYTKQKLEVVDDLGFLISLVKTLSKDTKNLKVLKNLEQYLFYIEPKHFFYLLYFSIRQQNFVPKLIKTEKKEEKENKTYDRIQHIFGWSNRELKANKIILDKVITDKKFWNDELGVKNEKY